MNSVPEETSGFVPKGGQMACVFLYLYKEEEGTSFFLFSLFCLVCSQHQYDPNLNPRTSLYNKCCKTQFSFKG